MKKIVGTKKNDALYGGKMGEKINGKGGDDIIVGGKGDDVLFGGKGNDTLIGGAGTDIMKGGAGRDTFFLYSQDQLDLIMDFESGKDTIFVVNPTEGGTSLTKHTEIPSGDLTNNGNLLIYKGEPIGVVAGLDSPSGLLME